MGIPSAVSIDGPALRHDVSAGFVGALASLPQAVAYGLIAVSPLGPEWAVFGITASVGASILYGGVAGALTSHPFLVSGPRAVTALVLATAIQAALDAGYDAPVALALAFLGVAAAGALQVAAGFLRLGHVVSYVPVPVLAGFVNASAVLVLLSSLPMVLGLPDVSLIDIVLGGITQASPWAIIVGGATVVLCFACDGRSRILPAALVALGAGAVIYHAGIGFAGLPSGPEVGRIDLLALFETPALFAAGLDWQIIAKEADIPLLAGLSIGLLATFDTVLSTSALDMQSGGHSDANHDLRVHGAINVAMGLLGFLPGSGTLSRSNAVIKSGARTRVANVSAAVIFGLMLALLSPIVAALPLWATSGMLFAVAVQAIDQPTIDKIAGMISRKVPYPRVLAGDVSVTLAVVLVALTFNLIAAVGVGILLAVLLFVLGMGRDPVRRTYRGDKVRSKVQRAPEQFAVLEREGRRIAVIELQGALFFGACAKLQARALDLLEEGVEYLILDFRHLTSIDSTGSVLLRTLNIMCAEAGGRLMLSYVEAERRIDTEARQRWRAERDNRNGKPASSLRWIWLNMHANGVIASLGEDRILDDTDSALAACEELLLGRLGRSDRSGSRGIIASSPIFDGLDREQIVRLGRYARRQRFEGGETVFRQGDPGDKAYLLVLGRMDVMIDIPGSTRKRRVSALSEGTVFAEMGLIDGSPRSATVAAVRPSSCLSIDAGNFARLQSEVPDIALVLMRNLSRQFADRLRLANNMISELER